MGTSFGYFGCSGTLILRAAVSETEDWLKAAVSGLIG